MEKENMVLTEQTPDPVDIPYTDEWWKAREDELVFVPEHMRAGMLRGFIQMCGAM